MRCGIPAYRLPREVLDGELARFAALGIKISLDHRVQDVAKAETIAASLKKRGPASVASAPA